MAVKKVTEPLKLGDLVRIPHFGNQRARVVELWGALGEGGKQMYRVRVLQKRGEKTKPIYIDLAEDDIVPIPPKAEE
jgi:hypothetical protein